jgi:hypothetical protein
MFRKQRWQEPAASGAAGRQWECGLAKSGTTHLQQVAKVTGTAFEWLATGKEALAGSTHSASGSAIQNGKPP